MMQADTSEGVSAEQIEVLMVLTSRFEGDRATTVAPSLWLFLVTFALHGSGADTHWAILARNRPFFAYLAPYSRRLIGSS